MESIWKKTAELPKFEELHENKKCDVLIIGGGMAGILTAFMLDNLGVDYMLVEADRICGGVTGNTTAKITSQHGLIYNKLIDRFGEEKARLYYEANERALENFRALSRLYEIDFEPKDSYVYSTDNKRKLECELEALDRIGIKAKLCEDLSLPIKTAGAVRFENQAQMNPLKLISAIAPKLNIYEKTRIVGFDGKCFFTESNQIYAKKTIVATHFPFINKHGNYFLKMYQHRSYVVALKRAGNIDGMCVDEKDTGLSFRGYEDMLLLGGGGHRTGKRGGGWSELEAFAQKNYPCAKIVCRWAAQDCVTLDGAAYIGMYSPSTPDLFVATGFNKWGMTSSMLAAEILTDAVLGKSNEFADLFSPSREMYLPKLAVNISESFLNFINPIGPRCPHLGCALKWNKLEHSWDCACHGSRFTKKGRVLDNPANTYKDFKI